MSIFQHRLITAIIPVRLSKDKLYDEPERILRIIATLPESYEVLIVDYGTPDERKAELADVAARTNARLIRVETGREPFSIGHARDIGTQHATTPLVIYHDIDFLLSPQGYNRVIAEARLRGMFDNAYAFFALPGAYLTEDFTQRYLSLHESGDGEFADMQVHDGIMRNDKAVYEHHTFAISAIVANRLHLLAVGGHDRSFTGHGAEDFELMHRLTSYFNRGPRTREYYKNTKNNSILNYEGFRAYYALYGIDVFQRGTVISHLWHPRRKDVGYVGTNNQMRVSKAMHDYDRGATVIQPLEDLTSNEYTLVLVKPRTSPALSLRHAFPAFGRYSCIPEENFANADALVDFVSHEGFTRVFFLNPYGNEHRLSLYRALKDASIRYIAYDRGAYNNSWFFDTRGFLGESESYSRQYWDTPLSDDDRERTLEWIDRLRLNEETLEKNGASVGADHLRQSLQLGDRKVIFVALQRPSDTATIYFSGQCESAAGFNSWVAAMASAVDSRRYVVVAKKHPLETERPEIENIIFAPDDAHIRDLIDLSDKVVVINSGTGLIAATLGKPVICCGRAFYDHEGFTHTATSCGHLIQLAQQELSSDAETRLRFVKYLVNDFYSFGATEYIEKTKADGSLRRLSRRTVFSEIRGLTNEPIHFGEQPGGVSLDAPLFYSYGGRAAIMDAMARGRKSEISPLRRRLVPVVRPFIQLLGNSKDIKKYDKDPVGYFLSLKNPTYRAIGKMIFPPKRDFAGVLSPPNS
ncbi:glycosyltransferase [Rhizobium sp. SEMIA 4085]|uniref:Capsule polysaccharide biosynthesis protein n=1 Tax=Rhizobium gallicum bv. gallicum R602sp TaxID=1041138 RepID=A0A0B4X735_9HYPH|nr:MULTISPECIES: glycosyltransferase [Rhizobium]AJD42383.1 capsule polysaccharide biosynthesis protein [Rhizobium gallicum bv. gallicum R602sp]NNH31083.1 glycosyltransferase [Rhizobium sp. SEMIA 4085]